MSNTVTQTRMTKSLSELRGSLMVTLMPFLNKHGGKYPATQGPRWKQRQQEIGELLKPALGHYTVEEAVRAFALLDVEISLPKVLDEDDSPGWVLSDARDILSAFILTCDWATNDDLEIKLEWAASHYQGGNGQIGDSLMAEFLRTLRWNVHESHDRRLSFTDWFDHMERSGRYMFDSHIEYM